MLGGHHPMLIRAHLDHVTLLDRIVAAVEDEIEAALDAIPAAWGITPTASPARSPGPDAAVAARRGPARGDPRRQPRARQGDHRRNRPGHDPVPDRGPPGLLGRPRPVARQSGPRSRKPGKGQGDAYLKGYCTQAATGAARTDTFLGERLRRLSRRLGGNRARCAVGSSILVIIWHLLADPSARFTDLGPGWHDAHSRPRPQDPRPPPPAPGPRPRRHHHPRRRLNPKPPSPGP